MMNLKTMGQQGWRLLPVFFLTILMLILWEGLYVRHHNETVLHKEFPFPEFSLTDVRQGKEMLTLAHLKGHVGIVHVWATWCGICVKEHEEWLSIKNRWTYPLIGIVYRDDVTKVLEILNRKGDPYTYLV